MPDRIECPRCGAVCMSRTGDDDRKEPMKHILRGSADECRGCNHDWKTEEGANPVLGPFFCTICNATK